MGGATGSGVVGSRGSVWRRPPWSIPRGRRPGIRQRALDALIFCALMASWVGGAAQAYEPRAYQVVYFTAVAIAVAYGVTAIGLAGRRRLKPVIWAGLTSTPAASRWYGLAFVAPALLGLSIALFFYPLSDAGWVQARFALAYWAAPGTYAACLLLARALSNAAVREAIVGGFAPMYFTSPVGGWWWNESTWVNSADAAPEGALRSPDGNYWWTGDAWLAMPPRRRRS